MRDAVREFDRIAVSLHFKVSRRMYQKLYTYASDHKLSLAEIIRAGVDKMLIDEKDPVA